MTAQPYAQQMISSFLAFGSSATSGVSTTTLAPSVATTTPESQVVFDNPKDLPEPWNPKPC
jgi:hypothetical protein